MPQALSDKLEPNTSQIIDRIKAINDFYDAGYDVHINYSPIIHYTGWLDDYQNLSTVPQLMTAPPIEYTNMPSNNAFGITGEDLGITQPSNLGLGDMMTAETLWKPTQP